MVHLPSRIVVRLEPNFGRREFEGMTPPDNKEDDPLFAECNGEQTILLIVEPPSKAGHRLFIAWQLGFIADYNLSPWFLRIIELTDSGKHWTNWGPVSAEYLLDEEEKGDTKVIELGSLNREERKALEEIGSTMQVRTKNTCDQWDERTWIKNVLQKAVRRGLLDEELIQGVIDDVLAPKSSQL